MPSKEYDMLHNIWTKIVPNGMAFKTACASKGQIFFFFWVHKFWKKRRLQQNHQHQN